MFNSYVYKIKIVLPLEQNCFPMFCNPREGSPAQKIINSAVIVTPSPGSIFVPICELKRVADLSPNERAIILNSNDLEDFTPLRHFQERIPNANSLSFPKDSELKSLFDYQVLKLLNSGLLDKIRFDNFERSNPGDRTGEMFLNEIVGVGIDGLYFPISLFSLGIILASFIVIIERQNRCVILKKLRRGMSMRKKVPKEKVSYNSKDSRVKRANSV